MELSTDNNSIMDRQEDDPKLLGYPRFVKA